MDKVGLARLTTGLLAVAIAVGFTVVSTRSAEAHHTRSYYSSSPVKVKVKVKNRRILPRKHKVVIRSGNRWVTKYTGTSYRTAYSLANRYRSRGIYVRLY